MQKFRRRPGEGWGDEPPIVEAIQVRKDNVDEILGWCNGREVKEYDALDESKHYVGINYTGPRGTLRASEGDYIVKEPTGDMWSTWPEAFESTFEKVE